MRNLKSEILNFLEDHDSPYVNKKGVEMDLSSGDLLVACCNVPGFIKQKEHQFEYLVNHESIKSFIDKFSIDSLAQLDKIDPELIDQLFQKGEVELWCHIYPSEDYLVFKKRGENFIVIDE